MDDVLLNQTNRMIPTVAWLYHTRGLRQSEIADRLNISQSRVSRLLDQAVKAGIVRTTVILPADEQSVVEQELEQAYGLRSAHVYDIGSVTDESQLVLELGQLLALQLQAAPLDAEVIGFTSWSRTLQEAVRHLGPLRNSGARCVVEMLGDLGPPALQHLAAQNTQQLADLVGAEPMFLRMPGVVPNRRIRKTLLDHDSHARTVLEQLDHMDLALTGFGSGAIVPPLKAGDNFFTEEQVAHARKQGAVAEVNLRYIDPDGHPVVTDLDELVVGATLEQLRDAPRRLGVGGGPAKYEAVRAVLRGGWVNILVTDAVTAQWLLDHQRG